MALPARPDPGHHRPADAAWTHPPPGSQPNGPAPNRYASGSMPPAPRSPACEPRTTPSASRSPATSACSEPATKPSRAAVTRPRPLPTAPATTCLRRQKHLSTRYYLQTTPDNRRYGRFGRAIARRPGQVRKIVLRLSGVCRRDGQGCSLSSRCRLGRGQRPSVMHGGLDGARNCRASPGRARLARACALASR